MMRARRLLSNILVLWLAAFPVVAGQIWVVSPKDAPVTSLSKSEVAGVFLGLRPEFALIPLDHDDAVLRAGFYRAVANMSLARLRAHWARQVFTGRANPPARWKETMSETQEIPSNTVTYLPAGQLPDGWKLLLSIGF